MKTTTSFISLVAFWLFLTAAIPVDYFSRGKAYMAERNFELAVDMYEKALLESQESNNTFQSKIIIEQLAEAHFKMKNYLKSEWYYNQLIQKGNPDPKMLFEYAQLQQLQGRLNKAITYYEKWGVETGLEDDADKYTEFCQKLLNGMGSDPNIKVEPLALNTQQFDEFSPVIHPHGKLIFTSNRPLERLTTEYATNKPPAKLFEIEEIGIGKNDGITPMLNNGKNLYHQGSASFTADGKTMYYTANVVKSVKPFFKADMQYTLGIYKSHHDGYRWSKPELLPFNTQYNCAFPAVSADGSTLVFASDMPPGQGGMDLFICNQAGDNWTKPVNMGKLVNTNGNDLYPCFNTNGDAHLLYFSTDGRPGCGGLDIYSSKLNHGVCDSLELLPGPINSSFDDFGYVSAAGNDFGYFSSNRAGSDDIYYFTYGQEVERAENLKVETTIERKVTDNGSGSGDVTNSESVVETETTPEEETTGNETVQEEEPIVDNTVDDEGQYDEVVQTYEPLPEVAKSIYVSGDEYLDSEDLYGYYLIMYSARNKQNLRMHRDLHYPDALLIRNRNGYYYIAYALSESKAVSEKAVQEARITDPKVWMYHP